jgi:hypothetical protein
VRTFHSTANLLSSRGRGQVFEPVIFLAQYVHSHFGTKQGHEVTGILARDGRHVYSAHMSRNQCWLCGLVLPIILVINALAAPRIHVITFGKWMSVEWFAGDEEKPLMLKVRPLVVDGRVKEYVVGSAHEVTDRLFVVRRAFRVNDSLPDEIGPSRWQWQRGGWLLVDRVTGRVAAINLPEFDAFYSAGSWFRDYVAYCGVSDEGKKIFAMVVQLSRRRPVLKKILSESGLPDDGAPDSACSAPTWQRAPARVTFESAGVPKQTFSIRGHVVDVVNDAEEEEEGSR